jgi:hypothetical protein
VKKLHTAKNAINQAIKGGHFRDRKSLHLNFNRKDPLIWPEKQSWKTIWLDRVLLDPFLLASSRQGEEWTTDKRFRPK